MKGLSSCIVQRMPLDWETSWRSWGDIMRRLPVTVRERRRGLLNWRDRSRRPWWHWDPFGWRRSRPALSWSTRRVKFPSCRPETWTLRSASRNYTGSWKIGNTRKPSISHGYNPRSSTSSSCSSPSARNYPPWWLVCFLECRVPRIKSGCCVRRSVSPQCCRPKSFNFPCNSDGVLLF